MLHYHFFLLCFRIHHLKGPKIQTGLKLNGIHQLLVYADNVNLLGHDLNTIKKNKQALTDATKGVGLEVNMKKTRYMLMSHPHNAGQK
jgi:hypothetical protein